MRVAETGGACGKYTLPSKTTENLLLCPNRALGCIRSLDVLIDREAKRRGGRTPCERSSRPPPLSCGISRMVYGAGAAFATMAWSFVRLFSLWLARLEKAVAYPRWIDLTLAVSAAFCPGGALDKGLNIDVLPPSRRCRIGCVSMFRGRGCCVFTTFHLNAVRSVR